MNDKQGESVTIDPKDARAGRIVKGGAIARILVTSTIAAAFILIVAYLVFF